MSNNSYKIVVFGALNAGKTTFVEKVSGQELFLKGEFESITTSFDFVQVNLDDALIHLFATPGHRRFSFMWPTLATGMDGAVLLLDSTVGVTPVDRELVKFIEEYDVPYILVANKSDICKLELSSIRDELKVNEDVPIVHSSSHTNQSLEDILIKLIDNIIQHKIDLKPGDFYGN